MRLLERIIGRRCDYCGGTGRYRGYSPLDSLATFRHRRWLTCRRCGGAGRIKAAAA